MLLPLLQMLPSALVFDAAYLCRAKAKLARKSNPLAADLSAVRYFTRHGFCNFCCYAALSVLHSTVLAHIHLIFLVRRPAKIVDAIIAWVSIVVSHIGVPNCRRIAEKGERHQTVDREPLEALTVFQDNKPIATVVGSGFHYYRCFPSVRLRQRCAPFARLSSPRPDLTRVTHFVMVEIAHSAPLNGLLHV